MSKLIPLTRGQLAIVDDADYPWLMQWKWYAAKRRRKYYALRAQWGNNKDIAILMHRVILEHHGITGEGDGKDLDHIDGDGLNNQRYNLRWASPTQNSWNLGSHIDNTSGFKGVSRLKYNNQWHAQIQVNRVKKHIGSFNTPEEAARAYDEAAQEYFGEFAWLNFPHKG